MCCVSGTTPNVKPTHSEKNDTFINSKQLEWSEEILNPPRDTQPLQSFLRKKNNEIHQMNPPRILKRRNLESCVFKYVLIVWKIMLNKKMKDQKF